MQSRQRRPLLFLPLLLLFPLDAAPQQKPQIPAIGETIEVSIINVDVVVTDAKGNRVRGLRKDDFEILENKSRQPISNFAEYSSSAQVGTVAVDAPQNVRSTPRQQRTVVIFVEQMKLTEFEAKPMVKSIRDLLEKTIGEGDAVSVVMWDRSSELQVSYTDDWKKIDEALERVVDVTTRQMFDRIKQLREDVQGTLAFEAEVAEMAAQRDIETPLLQPESAGDAAAAVQAISAMTEMKRRVNAINATINSMAGREGKKILILATRRLGEVAGGEFFFGTGTRTLSPQIRQKYGTAAMMKTIVDNANAAGVTIYPIYAPGVGQSMPDASTEVMHDATVDSLTHMNEMLSLAEVARKTGGMVAGTVTDIVNLMPRVAEDVADYYSLAYRGDLKRGDRARDIVVRTKNRAYTVRSRRQYVEKSDATRMKDRVVATLFRDFDESSFAIEVELGTPREQGRRELFPLKIRIPIKDLTILPNGEKNAGAFSVFVATSIDVGRISDVTQQTQAFEIANADMDRALAGHFTYNYDLVVDDKADRVAVGVFDEISKTYALLRLPIPGRQRIVAASR